MTLNHFQSSLLSHQTITRFLANGIPFDIRITGSSMEPYLRKGDYVRIQCCDHDYENGELVLIDWGTTYVVHRLVNQNPMMTKGDNMDKADPLGLDVVCRAYKTEPRCTGEREKCTNGTISDIC